MLNMAIKLMTQEILPKTFSIKTSICLKSMIEMLGNLLINSFCNLAELVSSGVWVVKTLNCGAFSKIPLGKTIEKFNFILHQSTDLILAILVRINTPCTLKVKLSPTISWPFWAMLSAIDIDTGNAAL